MVGSAGQHDGLGSRQQPVHRGGHPVCVLGPPLSGEEHQGRYAEFAQGLG